MPDPDFDKMAHTIARRMLGVEGATFILHREAIAEQLRLVWNARGAADIAKLESEIPNVWTAAAPAGPLTRALRTLDR